MDNQNIPDHSRRLVTAGQENGTLIENAEVLGRAVRDGDVGNGGRPELITISLMVSSRKTYRRIANTTDLWDCR